MADPFNALPGIILAILLLIDMRQTLRIGDRPDVRETNPLLRRYIKDAAFIRAYFTFWIWLDLMAVVALSNGIKHWQLILFVQGVVVALELKCVLGNYRLKLGL